MFLIMGIESMQLFGMRHVQKSGRLRPSFETNVFIEESLIRIDEMNRKLENRRPFPSLIF